ncbi:MAG TPA: hypothetical protein VNB06_09535 [Thermoanaerobaculia bacterium]|nr:hypothetical protein [Thermoanaerobaculia bacterium]
MACNGANAPEDLFVLRSDGSEMRRLTSDVAKDRGARWDPSGERQPLRRLDLPVGGRALGSVAGWSRDDRYLYVRSAEGVEAVDLESGRRKVVAPARAEAFLSLSRDGSTLLVEEEILDSDIWLLEYWLLEYQ